MRCKAFLGIVAAIILSLITAQCVYSQDFARHTPNFPYTRGPSAEDILKNTTILSILKELINGSASYREAIENLERLGAIDHETAGRLAAAFGATGDEVLGRVGDPQLNEMIEMLKEGSLDIEELKSILQYADQLYSLGIIDVQDYTSLLNALSDLYRERGLVVPPDITSRMYSMLELLIEAKTPLPLETLPQSVPSLPNIEGSASSAPLSFPQAPPLPSIGTPAQLDLSVVLAVSMAALCIPLALLLRGRMTTTCFHRMYRGFRSVGRRAEPVGEGSLDPIAIYWMAVRHVERLSKVRKVESATHREYLGTVGKLVNPSTYTMFTRITQLYELYRFGFRRDSGILDEAARVYSRMVEGYG
ncbi:MAG: hypothetical protein RMI45_00560 [Ignisphaera sp.]|nr:hypothetical protein [Ignisphaera sp.]MDW8084717.1 hypothetical protein [Ignisphaera sp.]